jgi:hypothetical protein
MPALTMSWSLAAGFGTKVAVFSITGSLSEPRFRPQTRSSTNIRLIVRAYYMGTDVPIRNHARKIIAVTALAERTGFDPQ